MKRGTEGESEGGVCEFLGKTNSLPILAYGTHERVVMPVESGKERICKGKPEALDVRRGSSGLSQKSGVRGWTSHATLLFSPLFCNPSEENNKDETVEKKML